MPKFRMEGERTVTFRRVIKAATAAEAYRAFAGDGHVERVSINGLEVLEVCEGCGKPLFYAEHYRVVDDERAAMCLGCCAEAAAVEQDGK